MMSYPRSPHKSPQLVVLDNQLTVIFAEEPTRAEIAKMEMRVADALYRILISKKKMPEKPLLQDIFPILRVYMEREEIGTLIFLDGRWNEVEGSLMRVVRVKLEGNNLVIPKCPECGKRHKHGAGGSLEDAGGHRSPHCAAVRPLRGYSLLIEDQDAA